MKILTSILALFMGMIVYVAQPMAKESPMVIEGAKTVSAAEAKALFDKGIKFIDVRKNSDWDAGRVPGAVHIELKKKLSQESLSKTVGKDQEFVFYCNGPRCMRSSKASAKAVSWGFTKVYYFRDGLPSWQIADYPIE